MAAKISISLPVEPNLAAKLDAAIVAEASTGTRVTRTSFIRSLLEERLAEIHPLPRRTRATVAKPAA